MNISTYLQLVSLIKSRAKNEKIINPEVALALEKKQKEDEYVKKIIDMELPMDFENVWENSSEVQNVSVSDISDGLILSLNNLARVDIEYIAKISNHTLQEVIHALKGYIIQDPEKWGEVFYKGWVTKEEYLTGNLKHKYQVAKNANLRFKGFFENNLLAIEKLGYNQAYVTAKDIYVFLGSPWLPLDVVVDFIKYLLNASLVDLSHDNVTGSWSIHSKGSSGDYYLCNRDYGTAYASAYDIIERTLNQTDLVAYDKVKDKYVKNEKETLLLLEKQAKINEKFRSWIFATPKRREQLTQLYNNYYCVNYTRHYDGSFLTLPGLNPAVHLEDFQKNAVARVIFSPNTLLAHDVGSGKTFEMIAAGHELKRMKLAKKIMYVVPNSIIGQWYSMYQYLYPNANVLKIEPKDFTPAKRNDTLNDIIYNDYDGIIIAYSSFDSINLSPKIYQQIVHELYGKLEEVSKNSKKRTSTVSRKLTMLSKGKYGRYKDLMMEDDEHSIFFDDLGIDRLFIDEAHNYKNVDIESSIKAIGIEKTSSTKANCLMDKVHYLQSKHDGRGVVFATATPITNSISDIFIMQKYLQPGELEMVNLNTFDAWIANFAERENVVEIDMDTTKYRIRTRYSKFHNLPELTLLLSNIADFHHIDKEKELPDFNGYTDVMVERTKEFTEFLNDISERADLIRSYNPRLIKKGDTEDDDIYDNFLLITHDGRSAALDIRLVDPTKKFNLNSKVYECSKRVFEVYQKTTDFKGTQIIFCDISTPKDEFNIYDELKRLLISFGIPECEIEYIHNAPTDAKRQKLFKQVNEGSIRVLIGSTFKLGLGVNVQKRLYAIHHIDVPWRPADMVQREGRLIRPGNSNKEVFIYRYIVEKSFDAYSWQIIETKQQFISKLLNNSVEKRDGSDIDDSVLNYAEIKALAIGDSKIKRRVEVYNEIQRLINLQSKYIENRSKLAVEVKELEARLPKDAEFLNHAKVDYNYTKHLNPDNLLSKEERFINRQVLFDGLNSSFNQEKDVFICEICEFKIFIPAHQREDNENLFLKLVREGTYDLRVLNNLNGIITRVENFIIGFEKYYKELSDKYQSDLSYYKKAKSELSNNKSYTDEIETKQKELAKIDESLGITL